MQRVFVNIPSNPMFERVVRASAAEVGEAIGLRPERIEDLKLAVSEAVTNSIVHAFRSTDAGTFTVAVDVRPHESVTVCVADEGEGLTPRADSPGAGLGLGLISTLATSVEVHTPPRGRGTEIRMMFALTG